MHRKNKIMTYLQKTQTFLPSSHRKNDQMSSALLPRLLPTGPVTVRPPCQIEFGDLGVRGSRTRLQRWISKRGRSQKGNRSCETSRDNGDDERRFHKSERDLESSETLTRDLETYRVKGN